MANERTLSQIRREREKSNSLSSSSSKKNTGRTLSQIRAKRNYNNFKNLQSDLNSTNSIINSAYSSWQTQDSMKNYKQTVNDTYNQLSSYNDYYRDSFSDEDVKTMSDILASYQNALDNWDNTANLYSYYQNADAFNTAKKNQELSDKYKGSSADDIVKALHATTDTEEKKFLSTYSEYDNYEDFKKALRTNTSDELKSAYNQFLLENPTAKYDSLKNNTDFEELSQYDASDYDKYESGKEKVSAGQYKFINEGSSDTKSDKWESLYNMTDEEKALGNYIYNTQGQDAWQEYLDDISVGVAKRQSDDVQDKWAKSTDKNFLTGALGTLANTTLNIATLPQTLTEQLGAHITGETYNPYIGASNIQLMTNASQAKLHDSASNVFDSNTTGGKIGNEVMGIGYSALSSGLQSRIGQRLFGGAYNVLMGAGSYAQTYADAIEGGMNEEKASQKAFVAGLVETATEQIGMNWAFGKGKTALTTVIKQFAAEGSEELVGNIANLAYDVFRNGGQAEIVQEIEAYMSFGYTQEEAMKLAYRNFAKETAEAFVSAGLSASFESKIHETYVSKQGSKIDREAFKNYTGINTEGLSNWQMANKYSEALDSAYEGLDEATRDGDLEEYNSSLAQIVKLGSVIRNTNKDTEKKVKNLNTAEETTDSEGNKLNIKNVSDDKVILEDGRAVDINEVTFSKDDAYIVTNAAEIGDKTLSEEYVKFYEGQNVSAYDANFGLAVSYARLGLGTEELMQAIDKNVLSEAQALTIYKDAQMVKFKENSAVRKMNDAKIQKWDKQYKPGKLDTSSLDMDSLNTTEKRLVKFFDMFSRMGMNIRLISDASENSENGITEKNGTITINLKARYFKSIEKTEVGKYTLPTFAHESTHWMENVLGAEFDTFKDMVKTYMGDTRWDTYVANEMRTNNLERLAAESEVIARTCEDMLNDSSVVDRILSTADENKIEKLIKAIKNWFNELKKDIEELMKGYSSNSPEAEFLRRSEAEFKAVQDMWVSMFERALVLNQVDENATTESEESEQYSKKVDNKETLRFLNEQLKNGEYVTTYKSMRLDGYDKEGRPIMHSPMAAFVDGKFENEYKLGEWYEAVEHPENLLVKYGTSKSPKYASAIENSELVRSDGSNLYFNLDKGKSVVDGKKLGDVPARYNPYEHSSNLVLNDQFTSAYKRPELVTVEMRIPKSEVTSGYKAKFAKDAVGWTEWNEGSVAKALNKKGVKRILMLSRWAMPVRILSDEEVAQEYKKLLDGTDIKVSNRVVTPNLLKELIKAGVSIRDDLGKEKGIIASKIEEAIKKEDKKYSENLVGKVDNTSLNSLKLDDELGEASITMNRKTHFIDDRVLINSIARRKNIARGLKTVEYLLPEDIEGNAVTKNGSYGRSVEHTLLCVRSLVNNWFTDKVAEKVGRPLTAEERIVASEVLAGKVGDQRECQYCYVAADRRSYEASFKKYIDEINDIISKANANKDSYQRELEYINKNYGVLKKEFKNKSTRKEFLKSVESELNGFVEFLNDRDSTPNMLDRYKHALTDAFKGMSELDSKKFTTETIRESMKNDSLYGWYIKDATAYSKSATKAKLKSREINVNGKKMNLEYVAYNGNVLKFGDELVDALNSEFGLRMYSDSDYVPAFLLEDMQIITDASVRGLKMLEYTKDIGSVKVFAPSGIGINVSTYGVLDNAIKNDGHFKKVKADYLANPSESTRRLYLEAINKYVVYDGMQGANWNSVKELRKQYPNVGAAFVATNDDLVEWALAQDWIDVVIPYHTVFAGLETKEYFNYTNYKNYQEDRKEKGWNKDTDLKSIPPTVHGNDFATYLKALEENHLSPRFSKWIDNPNYMKLVNETRMAYTELQPVQPEFDWDAAFEELARIPYEGRYGYLQGYSTVEEQSAVLKNEMADAVAIIKSGKISRKDVDAYLGGTKFSNKIDVTEITNEQYKEIKSHFGVTKDFKFAGYLLKDGSMTDFSGRHETEERFWKYIDARSVDHRDIKEVLPSNNNGVDVMINMIGNGNIRLIPETGGINLAVMPNEKQMAVIEKFIDWSQRYGDGYVAVDFDEVGGDTVKSLFYEKGTSKSRIISDIKNYFNGTMESDLMRFHTDNDFRYSLKVGTDIEVDKVLENKEYRNDVQLTDTTPSIITNQKGTHNYPLVMKASHIRENIFTEEEAKAHGLKVDKKINYHGLGKILFLEVINDLDKITFAYRGTKNADNAERRENYFLLISQHTDSDGEVINVPVYINEKAQVNEVFIDTNKIATVFGRSSLEDYIKKEIEKGNLVRIKKASNPVNGTAPIAGGYRKDASLTKIISHDNNSVKLSSKVDADGNTLSIGQQNFFAKSKARDDMGRLVKVYHGTKEAGFNVFNNNYSDDEMSFFFTDNPSIAKTYSGTDNIYSPNRIDEDKTNKESANYAVYLNLENPLIVEGYNNNWDELEAIGNVEKQFEYIYVNGENEDGTFSLEWQDLDDIDASVNYNMTEEEMEDAFGKDITIKIFEGQDGFTNVAIDNYGYLLPTTTRDYALYAKLRGYDGVIFKNIIDDALGSGTEISNVYVAFDSAQIKSVNNLSPTDSDDIRYSKKVDEHTAELLKQTKRLEKENTGLKEDVERLKKRLKLEGQVTKGKVLDEKKLAVVADVLLKETRSSYDKKMLIEELKNVYGYIIDNSSVDTYIDWDELMGKSYDVARKVLDKSKPIKYVDDYYKLPLMDIRSARIKLTEEQIQEARNAYGNTWRNEYRGRIRFDNNGRSLDSYWSEWASMYPQFFDEDTNPNDQIVLLSEVYDDLKDASVVYQRFTDSESVRFLATEIYDKFWNISTVNTTADKYNAKIKKLKFEHRKAMDEFKASQDLAYKMHYIADVRKAKAEGEKKLTDTKAHYKELVKNIRADKNKKLAEYKEYQAKLKDKNRDMAQRNALVNKITEVSATMMKWMQKGDAKKGESVPEVLKPVLSQLLRAIDFSSKQLLGLRGGQYAFMATKKDISFRKAINDISAMVREINTEEGMAQLGTYIDFPPTYQEDLDDIVSLANNIAAETGEDNIYILNEMNVDELTKIYNIVKSMQWAVRNLNKKIAGANDATIAAEAQTDIQANKALGDKKFNNPIQKFFEWQNALPVYAFKHLGEGATHMFEEIQNGWDKFAFNIKDIIDFAENTFTGKECEEWSKHVNEFNVLVLPSKQEEKNGGHAHEEKIRMTDAQVMSLYCLSKREHAKTHFNGGGIRVGTIKDGKKELTQTKNVRLSEEALDEIISSLSERQIEVADKLQEFMNTVCSEWGNEVSMKRYGVRGFTEKNYFPIKVDGNVLSAEPRQNERNIYALLNMGFTKPLVPRATAQMEIGDIFDVFTTHSSEMAKYNSIALPVLDMVKYYNYKEKDADGNVITMKGSIEQTHGKSAQAYIMNFLCDLNGNQESGRNEGFIKKATRGYKTAAVAANLQVALLQPLSYIRARVVLDDKYLIKGASSVSKINYGRRMAQKYCGIAVWKELELFDTNVSRGIDSKIKRNDTMRDKVIEKSMDAAGFMDSITWGAIWNACEAEVRDKTSLKGEELYLQTALRFREVVYKSQVVDSTMTRTDLMRDASMTVQTVTSFMSEPSTSMNILQDACIQFNQDVRQYGKNTAIRRNGKHICTAITTYVMSAAVEAVARGIIGKYRDLESDETMLEMMWDEFLQNVNPLSNIPIGRDVVSLMQGYSVDRMDMATIQSAIYAFNGWQKVILEGDRLSYKTVYRTLQAISQGTGIPMSSALREVISLWNATIAHVYPTLEVK